MAKTKIETKKCILHWQPKAVDQSWEAAVLTTAKSNMYLGVGDEYIVIVILAEGYL